MIKRVYLLFALVLGMTASLLSGCGGSDRTKISDIVNDPSRFLNHQVKVAGEVTQVYELPMGIMNLAAYRVNDNSGQIWVISHAGAPVKGDQVGLKGTVQDVAKLNLPVVGNILGNVIQEQERQRR